MQTMRMIFVAAILSLVLSPVQAANTKQTGQKYQVLYLASFINGWCYAKEHSSLTAVSPIGRTTTVPAGMTEEEKDQCAYVRQSLASKCLERGDCPKYEVWVRNRAKTN